MRVLPWGCIVLLLADVGVFAGTPSPSAPGSPSTEARLIQSVVEQVEHPIAFTGVVRSRVWKDVGGKDVWILKIHSVKTLVGVPRDAIEVVVPCLYFFRENGFNRVSNFADLAPGPPSYHEKPLVFLPGDHVFMVAQFLEKSPVDPHGSWIMTLTRFFQGSSERLFAQVGYSLDGGVADSLAALYLGEPSDTSYVGRDLVQTSTTITEVKSVLGVPAKAPETKDKY
jgi:hypothetical protein